MEPIRQDQLRVTFTDSCGNGTTLMSRRVGVLFFYSTLATPCSLWARNRTSLQRKPWYRRNSASKNLLELLGQNKKNEKKNETSVVLVCSTYGVCGHLPEEKTTAMISRSFFFIAPVPVPDFTELNFETANLYRQPLRPSRITLNAEWSVAWDTSLYLSSESDLAHAKAQEKKNRRYVRNT